MSTNGRPKHLLGAAILVLVLVCLAALAAAFATHGEAPGELEGYPQRIGFERPSPTLPERPGPLAATLFDNAFGTSRPLGVTSSGDLYELPPGANVLSPDGHLLLTTRGPFTDPELAIHDVTTGEVQILPHRLSPAGLVYWSLDGSTVLGRFGRDSTRVLDVPSGRLTRVGQGTPPGFLDSGEAVTVTVTKEDSADAGVVATTTDLTTGRSRSVDLRLNGPWLAAPNAALGASVSPEGMLALVEAAGGGSAVLRMFSLVDGVEHAPRKVEDWDGCPIAWLDGDPVLPTATRGFRFSLTAGAELATAEGPRPLVAVHFRMQSSCLLLTTSALEAGPNRALFGTSTAVWTWYWWQLLLLALLALLTLLAVWWAVRRRRSSNIPAQR